MTQSILRKMSSMMLGLVVAGVSGYAVAQDVPGNNCVDLDQNELWQVTFSEFSEEYSLGRYEKAEAKVQQLLNICSSSPLVNYSAGMTYMALKQTEKAKKAYLDAIKNTQYFAVEDEFYKRMLDAYYRAEHEKDLCEIKDLTKCQSELADAQHQIQALNARLANSVEGLVAEELKERELKKYGVIMWTGTGVGIAGLGLMAAGLCLMLTHNKVKSVKSIESNAGSYYVNLDEWYVPGVLMLGVGSGLVASGVIMAGYGGYHYTHTIADGVTMGLNVNPGNLEFGMTF